MDLRSTRIRTIGYETQQNFLMIIKSPEKVKILIYMDERMRG
jgi:hypothetical protein